MLTRFELKSTFQNTKYEYSYHFGTTKMKIFQRERKEKEPFFFLNENPRNISMLTRFELKSTFQNTKYEYSYYFGTIKMRIFQRGIKEPFFFFLTKENSLSLSKKFYILLFNGKADSLRRRVPVSHIRRSIEFKAKLPS